mmetsp:Transcript_12335/g.40531  ORF Transcript_12335/g.40531 Transcript_12335/m.40531 type:complete len:325 (-) Transcript_12335:359-1333(-)
MCIQTTARPLRRAGAGGEGDSRVYGEQALFADEFEYLERQVERVHVSKTLDIVEIVVPVRPLAAGVSVEAVEVDVVAELEREKHGEEARHRLAVVLRVVLALERVLELHPRPVRAVREDGVEEHGRGLHKLFEQRLAEVVAREVRRGLEHHEVALALGRRPPPPQALEHLAHVVRVHNVERALPTDIRLEPANGGHIDSDDGIVRVDVGAILFEEDHSRVADDSAAPKVPLWFVEREELKEGPRKVVEERLVFVLVLEPMSQDGVLERLVVHHKLPLVRDQIRPVRHNFDVVQYLIGGFERVSLEPITLVLDVERGQSCTSSCA